MQSTAYLGMNLLFPCSKYKQTNICIYIYVYYIYLFCHLSFVLHTFSCVIFSEIMSVFT